MFNTKTLFISLLLFSFAFKPTTAVCQFIGVRTINLNDTARHRPLITEVWYPATDSIGHHVETSFATHNLLVRDAKLPSGKLPLVLISHGTGGGRLTLHWLAEALANSGFIVAAVDHWGNTFYNKIAIDFVTPWQRPQDISFVLTQLLKDRQFSPTIDRSRIGAAGFSIGGYTVLALAGGKLSWDALQRFFGTPEGKQETNLPEFPNLMSQVKPEEIEQSFRQSPALKDNRIKAFFAMCPAIGQGFTSAKQFKGVNSPVYIVGAEGDRICPVNTNALHYHQLIKGSEFYLVKGKVGHYTFLNEVPDEVKNQAPVYFTDDTTVNRHAVHEQVSGLAVSFFQQALR